MDDKTPKEIKKNDKNMTGADADDILKEIEKKIKEKKKKAGDVNELSD